VARHDGNRRPGRQLYVAFFRDGRYLVVPYIFDSSQEYEPPGFQMYGPEGLAASLNRRAKAHCYSMDNGELLTRGHSFGDEERLQAFQILARSVLVALARESEDVARQRTLFAGDRLAAGSVVSVADIVENFGHKLEDLRRRIDSMIRQDILSAEAVRRELIDLRDLCERSQAEMTDLFMMPSLEARRSGTSSRRASGKSPAS
jgi:hypothetical protein